MTPDISTLIRHGETSYVQFKREFTSPREMAKEMVAFANGEGGIILLGIEDKTGKVLGLNYERIQQASRDLGTTATDLVKPTIYISTDVVDVDGKMVLVCTVPEGKSKPYKDAGGTIWVKQGADKRRVTENNEILGLFQNVGAYSADLASVPGTSVKDIDTLALDRYSDNVYHKRMTDFNIPSAQLLNALHITDGEGRLTVAGLLYFGQRPQLFMPNFVIKAVWFYGNDIAGTEYRDSRDIEGTIPEMFDQGLQWLKSCLRQVQNGKGFNSMGDLEIPEPVLEELLQNALVHLDLLKPAAIRLLVFDDRVEIINPGCLPGNQTIEEVKLGNSHPRNLQLANFCVRTMPYRGLGSGIPRALSLDADICFVDSKGGNQFKAIVSRLAKTADKPAEKPLISDKTADKPAEKPLISDKTVDKPVEKPLIRSKTADKLNRMLDFIKARGVVKTGDICKEFNLSHTQARHYLGILIGAQKVIANGSNRNRTYSIQGYSPK